MRRTLWSASMILLACAVVCIALPQPDLSLLLFALGFSMIWWLESDIDWQRRLTRRDWRETLFETRSRTTIVGQVCKFASVLCLIAWFVVTYR